MPVAGGPASLGADRSMRSRFSSLSIKLRFTAASVSVFNLISASTRSRAGKRLATCIPESFRCGNTIVLALPRGGVPVGLEVARALDLPLDVFVVRKLGAPQEPELAIGAIASGGYEVLNYSLLTQWCVRQFDVAAIADREMHELQRREAVYREGRPAIDVRGSKVILVDDGLATGVTMRVALTALKDQGAARLLVAVPVGAAKACEEMSVRADLALCPFQPEPFHAISRWYERFTPVSDDEVRECLAASPAARHHV